MLNAPCTRTIAVLVDVAVYCRSNAAVLHAVHVIPTVANVPVLPTRYGLMSWNATLMLLPVWMPFNGTHVWFTNAKICVLSDSIPAAVVMGSVICAGVAAKGTLSSSITSGVPITVKLGFSGRGMGVVRLVMRAVIPSDEKVCPRAVMLSPRLSFLYSVSVEVTCSGLMSPVLDVSASLVRLRNVRLLHVCALSSRSVMFSAMQVLSVQRKTRKSLNVSGACKVRSMNPPAQFTLNGGAASLYPAGMSAVMSTVERVMSWIVWLVLLRFPQRTLVFPATNAGVWICTGSVHDCELLGSFAYVPHVFASAQFRVCVPPLQELQVLQFQFSTQDVQD